MNKLYFNIPILISVWHVEFKPFPFLKPVKQVNHLAYDYINDFTTFIDFDYQSYLKPKYSYTLNHVENFTEDYGKELLLNYYLYKKKSWKYPDLKKVRVEKIYLPYQFDLNSNELFEEISGKKKTLKKSERIFQVILKELSLS